MKRVLALLPLALLVAACQDQAPTTALDGPQFAEAYAEAVSLTPMAALGKAIYFDMQLSLRLNQSCATCHDPDFGFTGPLPGINLRGSVYMGSIGNAFGNRRPPSAAYATQSPILRYDSDDEVWVGGNFWDGRATGMILGFPSAEQALGPFLNPAEQALPDKICVIYRIAEGPYADLWFPAWGEDLRDLNFPDGLDKACKGKGDIPSYTDIEDAVHAAYERVGLSIAEFEGSPEVNAFSSKYDAYLAGNAVLTEEEANGLALFEGEKAMCSACHPSEGTGALFTDFTYDNLGIPANPLNPVYRDNPTFVDLGMGGVSNIGIPELQAMIDAGDLDGAVKVPTLRNVAKAPGTAPKSFGHNGVFKSLEQIVHFYNTRDVLDQCAEGEILPTPLGLGSMGFNPECWLPPEVMANMNTEELGNLGLTPEEERQIVAFLKTLSDGWTGR